MEYIKGEGKKMTQKFEHICEVCGMTKVMTPQEAFEEGRMGLSAANGEFWSGFTKNVW